MVKGGAGVHRGNKQVHGSLLLGGRRTWTPRTGRTTGRRTLGPGGDRCGFHDTSRYGWWFTGRGVRGWGGENRE